MAFGMGRLGYGLEGYGGMMPTSPTPFDEMCDNAETRMLIRRHPLLGWTTTNGQSFGHGPLAKETAMDHQSSIRDFTEGPLNGAPMHLGRIGLGWAGMNPLWAPHMHWMTDHADFRIFQQWQQQLATTSQTAVQSRQWLVNHIMATKWPNALFMTPQFRKLAETMADRMIAMSGNLAGNQQGRVELSQSSNNTQQTTNITTKTTTTVTTQMRCDAAIDFIDQVQAAGGSGMTQEQIQQAADQIRNGQKDNWVERNMARAKTPASQPMALPAPPAPPQPVYNLPPPPPPPAQVVPPAAPAQVVYYHPAPAPAQPPAQQATAGTSNFASTATTITSSSTSTQYSGSNLQQGHQSQMQIPGFQQPVYAMPPQSPPAQQYLQPAQQPQQITGGPAQTQYPQYNNQQHAQQQSQIAYAGTPQQASNQPQGYQQPGAPAPQYAGYTTGPATGQYVATSPPAAPDKPKKKKAKKVER